MNTFIYRPVLTVIDVLEAGACLQGTLEYIEENGLQIVGDTEKLLWFDDTYDYIKWASKKNGYGTGTCYGSGNRKGGGNGEGRGYGYFDGSVGYFSVYGDGYVDGGGYGDCYGDSSGYGDCYGDSEGDGCCDCYGDSEDVDGYRDLEE